MKPTEHNKRQKRDRLKRTKFVQAMRREGYTFEQIGRMLGGITKQAAERLTRPL